MEANQVAKGLVLPLLLGLEELQVGVCKHRHGVTTPIEQLVEHIEALLCRVLVAEIPKESPKQIAVPAFAAAEYKNVSLEYIVPMNVNWLRVGTTVTLRESELNRALLRFPRASHRIAVRACRTGVEICIHCGSSAPELGSNNIRSVQQLAC